MGALGWILLALLALVLLAVGLLAATPLHLRLAAESGRAQGRVTLEARTLWGRTPPVRLLDTDHPGAKARREARRPARRRDRETKDKGWSPPISWEQTRRIAQGVPVLVAGEAACIHIDRLDLDARIGTGDPAETGRLFGYAAPLLYGVVRETVALRLTPDFERATFEGRADLALHLTPIALLGPIIRLAWSVFVRPT
ncbi:DUF2953 domain-containing protein [Maritimibacter sp. HL-12]|uniref:DUF2953 domain-containing protein n=1 Tax=Maritimibacter sp. HL-12 TaxID=1162418 RepID=UPI000A0EEFA4|nr:DUF2953 domain-containing protein [Maritimibacter sp. HL-12]SMH49273.1 Protein of unknown function [Maritimibacter sp. HL-12]